MTGLTFAGNVDETGEIHLPKTMRKQIAAAFRGKNIEVTVKRRAAKHSDAQRGYYWACVLPGLGFEEAVKGSIRLQAVGFSADEARKTLETFGTAIAATGGRSE
jgi:hypothetical protein